MNRRDQKLDTFVGKNVEITFFDGDVRTGLLEFNRKYWGTDIESHMYSISCNGGDVFFRKTHVRKITEKM